MLIGIFFGWSVGRIVRMGKKEREIKVTDDPPRFEVTVDLGKRAFIVYAKDSEAAEALVMATLIKYSGTKVVGIKPLGPIESESHAPEVDMAPARETRK